MAEAPDTLIAPWGPRDGAPEPPAAAAAQPPARTASRSQEWLWGLLSTLLLAGWIALWAGWLGALALVAGVFVHEFGHLMVINWAGAGPSRIRIIPFFGGAATMSRAPDSEFKGVLIALAGPVFGLTAALPFFVVAVLTGQHWWIAGAFYIGALNLINLAPAAPLDGANALGPSLARIHPLLERGVLVAIALAGLAWSLQRGSILFAAVIAFGVARAFLAGRLRPASRPLTWVEWAASVGLYAVAVSACAAVTIAALPSAALPGGGINLHAFGIGGLR